MGNIVTKIHWISVTVFFLIYVVKTVLLLSNKEDLLQKFTKMTKVLEMIVSALFLISGVYLMTLLPSVPMMMWVKIGIVLASIPIAIIGFKKKNKILAALSLLMITAAYGIAESQKAKREKGETSETITAGNVNGMEIYNAKCTLCHGADGKAGLSGASDLSATTLATDSIKQIILHGRNTMVPIDITDEQASAVAAYVEGSLKGK